MNKQRIKQKTHNKSVSIEAYYFSDFLSKNANADVGKCLVICADKNILSTINFKSNFDIASVSTDGTLTGTVGKSYDTVIAINTLNLVVDYDNALQKIIKLLSPNGVLITTLLSTALGNELTQGMWGFTEASSRYIFGKYFSKENLLVRGYGNVLVGRYYLDGHEVSHLSGQELDKYDPYFPLLIAVRATKTGKKLNTFKKAVMREALVLEDEDKQTFRGSIATMFKRAYYFLDTPLYIARIVRGYIVRSLKQKQQYLNSKSTDPISVLYGFDRGKPIDRFYIENFLNDNKEFIKGRCLEIVDNQYTKKFGQKNVTVSDVLDIFPSKKANIHGDLRNLSQVKDNTYDCVIITQTFNVIDDCDSAIKESLRILKPGGTFLATLPTISPCWNLKINLWRFTVKGTEYLFGKYFDKKNVSVKGYGNFEAVKAFWVGFAKEDMSKTGLFQKDTTTPLIIGVRTTKNI